jgi:hypothetical protein
LSDARPNCIFCARHWNNALAGDQQVVVLVAESRFGKTRIVQEFYHWLKQQCDPANYWPDSLPRDNDSLHINPLFSEQPLGETEPPWLWWGIRWSRPGLRNTGQVDQCAVIFGADYLVPHRVSHTAGAPTLNGKGHH